MADSDSWYDNRRRSRRQLPHSTSRSFLRSPQGNVTFRRSMLDGDAHDKVEELTTSLKATSEVLTTADRMLEHYKQINTDQDDEIQRLRTELDMSTEHVRNKEIEARRRARSQVRFADQTNQESNDWRDSLKDLENVQHRMSMEISRDREERERFELENRDAVKRLEESFRRVEDDLRGSLSERERYRKLREEDDRRQRAEALSRQESRDERELLSESVRLALEKEREIQELRDQLRDSRRQAVEEELETKVKKIYDKERLEKKEKKEAGKLLDELKSVKNLINESANENKIKDEIKRREDENFDKRSTRERRLLKSLDDIQDELMECKREKRKLEQDLDNAFKRLEWTEEGRSSMLKQIEELKQELKIAGDDKTLISVGLHDCKTKLEESERQRDRLTGRMDSLSNKNESLERERESLLQQLEAVNNKLREKTRELSEKMDEVKERTKMVKESEDKKEELKSRALDTIKEYKIKWKRSEKEAEQVKKELTAAKEDLRKLQQYEHEGTKKSEALEKELKSAVEERNQLRKQLEQRSTENESEANALKKRLKSALDENRILQESFSSCKDECKLLIDRQQKLERLEEATSSSNEELKEGVRELASKKSRLEIKLKEEQKLREELNKAIEDAKEGQAKAKDEVASLYRQLQREREECNLTVKDMEEKMAKSRVEGNDDLKESNRRFDKQREEFEEQLADVKLQLADEKSTVKALRKQQEKDGFEILNMKTQITRLTEEKSRLKEKSDELQHDVSTKDELRDQDRARITELESEVRKCHHSLNRASTEQKDTFKKADAEKEYYVSELEKRSASLKEISRRNKELEDKERENQEKISIFQRRIMKLTKTLDDVNEALKNSMAALVDNQKLLDELYNFRGDEEERHKIHCKFARFQEQVRLLTRELQDAKEKAEEQKQDTKDASNLSMRLLESLNQLTTPHLSSRRTSKKTNFELGTKLQDNFPSPESTSSCDDFDRLKEDHNFKTPRKQSVEQRQRSTRDLSSTSSKTKSSPYGW